MISSLTVKRLLFVLPWLTHRQTHGQIIFSGDTISPATYSSSLLYTYQYNGMVGKYYWNSKTPWIIIIIIKYYY